MPEITLTVNGRLIKGKSGDTVLTICRANGIDIPTLCHLEEMSDVAACRLCVVEIQGERKPTPACTYPARDGLVIQTHTPQLEKYRRQILELMFAERNHFCMFCEQSGDCELQALAYKYQMDNVRFQGLFPALPVDTLSKFLAIDHNRCVLCGRCVRTCRQVAGIRTLDFSGRGYQTMISADIDQPLGESSCTLCGACLQACPTGGILSKPSLYRGITKECQAKKTTCPGCDIGCELKVLVKDNNLVRIESPKLTAPRGALCQTGRFELLKETRSRITSPMVLNADGELENCSLEDAISAIAQKLKESEGVFGGLVSTKNTVEAIRHLQKLITSLDKKNFVDTIDGADSRLISSAVIEFNSKQTPVIDPPLENILTADCILIIGADIDSKHPVVGNLVRRAVSQNYAKLITIDTKVSTLSLWTDLWLQPASGTERVLVNGLAKLVLDNSKSSVLKPELVRLLGLYETDKVTEKTGINQSQLQTAAQMLTQAKNSFIICGSSVPLKGDIDTVTSLLNLAFLLNKNTNENELNILFLKQNVNSRGAWRLGVADRDIKSHRPNGLFLLLGDDTLDTGWLQWLKNIDYLVVQTSYFSPAMEFADVVLPSRTWAEKSGSYVTTDGCSVKTEAILQPRFDVPSDEEILQALAQKIEVKAGRS